MYHNNSSHNQDGQPHNYRDKDRENAGREGNKIRRGPGRRLAKEKRLRNMDHALLQKYNSLSPALQEKVNATIELCYQEQMSSRYSPQYKQGDYPEEDIEIQD